MPKVFKCQLIEVIQPANSTATKLQFQDFPYLRNRQIFGIESLNNLDMSVSPTGKTPPTPTEAGKAFLTLYIDDLQSGAKNVGEWIQNVPFSLLHRVQTTTSAPFVRQMFDLTGQIVYWEKCYLNFGSGLGNTSDVSFCFNVYFK